MAKKGGGDSSSKSKSGGKDASKDDSKDKSKLKPANSINVRHILCEKHSKKEEALEKLRGGSKFDEVAREFSEDKARQGHYLTTLTFMLWCWWFCVLTNNMLGGSLGWKTRGSLIKEFEDVAYALEPSTTGNPKWGEVKTREGYHIMMVEGRK